MPAAAPAAAAPAAVAVAAGCYCFFYMFVFCFISFPVFNCFLFIICIVRTVFVTVFLMYFDVLIVFLPLGRPGDGFRRHDIRRPAKER